MSRGHSEAEKLLASQIAYLNINPGPGGHPVNIYEWIKQQEAILSHSDAPGASDQLGAIRAIREIIDDPGSGITWEEFSKWTVVDSCDHNNTTGMYASLIDPGDGSAIIGFRGTENYSPEQVRHDVSEADLMLLNNELTGQQADAEAYTRYIYEKYGDQYEYYDTSGHSLGGNLAEHSYITAPDGMSMGEASNIDGPGYSEEYILTHWSQIQERADGVYHYGASTVGVLLFILPGTHYAYIESEGENFDKHMAGNIVLEDGKFKLTSIEELGPVAGILSVISKTAELTTTQLFTVVAAALISIAVAGVTALQNAGEWLADKINDLLSAKAEFSVNLPALYDTADSFSRSSHEERSIAREVRNVANNLQYFSESAFFFRNELQIIAALIENDAGSSGAMADALRGCAENYARTDSAVGGRLTM